jgi:hypothetical protein
MMNVPVAMDAYRERNMAMPFGDVVAAKSKAVFMPFAASGLYQPAVGKPMYFQPDHELDGNNAIIRGIEILDSTQQASFFAQGVQKDNPTLASLHNALLYICNIEREIIATIPLYDLAKRGNDGKLFMTDFRTHVWQGCYVEMVRTTGLGSSVGLQFIVYYDPI